MPPILQTLNTRNPRLYLALFLGAMIGLSVYCYWLINIFPPTGKWIFLLTMLTSIVAAAGSFFLIELWLLPCWPILTQPQRWLLLGLSVLIGSFLLFAGTSAFKSPDRYLAFLLPNEKIEISVPPSKNPLNADVAIHLFSTSMGNVSFNSIKYQGWQRKGNLLVLTNRKDNSLEWAGIAGKQVSIVLSDSTQQAILQISTDGGEDTVNFSSGIGKQYLYTHSYAVPFYASRTVVILLGIADFSFLCFAIGLLIYDKRKWVLAFLHQTIRGLSPANQTSGEASTIRGWGIVTGTICVAILLRVFHLDYLAPLRDEYTQLFAAKALASGSALNLVYQRSLFIVTLPVALFFRVFGFKLWVARLPGVLFNTLAIIPLYLITKRINWQVALLSCILYATNPWLIAVSRIVREYGYYPFYFYWIIYGMVMFLEYFPNSFLTAERKHVFKSPIIFSLALLILPLIYMMAIDPNSTFKVISIAYGVFGLFVLLKIISKSKASIIILTAALITSLFAVLYLYFAKSGDISFHPLQGYWIRYFFPNPQQQWYFNSLAIIYVFGLTCAILLGIQVYKFNFIPSFFLVLFSLSLFFYIFFFTRYVQARYLFHLEFWFIPLVAIGFFCIWAFLRVIFSWSSTSALLVSLALLALSTNGSQILLPTFYNNYGWMPITEEYHDDVRMTQSFLLDKVKPGDALISTDYAQYNIFAGNSAFGTIYSYSYINDNSATYFSSIIAQHDSGWIVLDDQMYEAIKPFPLKTTFLNNKEIDYMSKVANEYIWRWSSK
ncbi:MAG TPA: glycosyltransferase family 39 protein [Anaerolineales bacterium]|nr:glycosyltransferase family 39 protein [Anaerolineales bacterium]